MIQELYYQQAAKIDRMSDPNRPETGIASGRRHVSQRIKKFRTCAGEISVRSTLFESALFAAVALSGAGAAAHAQVAPEPMNEIAPAAQPAVEENRSGAAPVEAPAEADAGISEVIVTARRVEERLQDVPISITVFNQDQLTTRNVASGTDLATYTPSLTSNVRYGTENASFAIRGFSQESRTTASVGMYFADVVAPRGGGNVTTGDGAGPGSFFDLQSVQVLKGPQGTLFGRNTTGGAILLVPQKPTSQFEGYAEQSVGNYGLLRTQAVVNAPLDDSARFRLAVDHQSRDGYLDNVSGVGPSDFGDIGYTAARASLVVDLAADLENYSIASYSRSKTHGQIPKVTQCDPTPSQANLLGALACAQIARQADDGYFAVQNQDPYAKTQLEQWQGINTTSWKATDTLTVKNIVSYAALKNDLRSELFGSNFILPDDPNLGPFAGMPLIFTNSRPAPGVHTASQSTFTEELQFQGNSADGRMTWQAGGYFESSKPTEDNGSQSPQTIACSDSAKFECVDVLGILAGAEGAVGSLGYRVGGIDYRNIGAYAQSTYALTDTLNLTAGLRYTWDRSESSVEAVAYRFPSANNPVPFCISSEVGDPTTPVSDASECRQHFEQSSSAPTWTVGLDYKPVQDLMLYGKYSRGYRQGSVNPYGADGYNSYKQEKVDTYEIGSKVSFDGAVSGTFNLALFYNDFTDQQTEVGFSCSTQCVSPNTGIVNAGSSRIYGAEVETTIVPIRHVTLEASYAYLNTKLQSLDALSLTPGSLYDVVNYTTTEGSELRYSPKHKFTATATYRVPLPPHLGRVSLGTTYVYTAEQASSYATPYGIVPSYELVNLNLAWIGVAGGPIDVALFATNVLDEKYLTTTAGIYDAAGFEAVYLGEPRMYGARIRFSFDGHGS
jgi:iron complex outermembrane receptor protein